VKYNGNGSTNQTIGTGLDNPTELMILKNTSDTTDWIVFGGSLFTRLTLNSTADDHGTYPIAFNADTTILLPQQSSQHANIAWNKSGDSYIAYCFHSVSGYSKIGSYTGDTTTPPNVNLGFEPRWILIKKTSTAASFNHWYILDTVRDTDGTLNKALIPSLSNSEATYTTDYTTISTSGFTPNGGFNTNGIQHMYLAFA
jgi:hypothetical protein